MLSSFPAVAPSYLGCTLSDPILLEDLTLLFQFLPYFRFPFPFPSSSPVVTPFSLSYLLIVFGLFSFCPDPARGSYSSFFSFFLSSAFLSYLLFLSPSATNSPLFHPLLNSIFLIILLAIRLHFRFPLLVTKDGCTNQQARGTHNKLSQHVAYIALFVCN